MVFKLEPRAVSSRVMIYQSPIIAVFLTLLAGMVMFRLMGTDPLQALEAFFIEPISSMDGIAELLVKAAPLILIAIGRSIGFQANVWNIGAEGQLTIGALFGGSLALVFYELETPFLIPAMLLAGTFGGMVWAAIPALLKTRFNTNDE